MATIQDELVLEISSELMLEKGDELEWLPRLFDLITLKKLQKISILLDIIK